MKLLSATLIPGKIKIRVVTFILINEELWVKGSHDQPDNHFWEIFLGEGLKPDYLKIEQKNSHLRFSLFRLLEIQDSTLTNIEKSNT